jgi:hypothetical protein
MKLADDYKISELKFDVQASKHRQNYFTWSSKLQSILAMFPQTSMVFWNQTINFFQDPEDVGNKALYLLIASRVDEYFQCLIKSVEAYGDKALTLIFKQCAHIEASDKHHFHHLFTSLRIRDTETATNFFRRFMFAKTEAEAAHNVYTDAEAVDFASAGLSSTKTP